VSKKKKKKRKGYGNAVWDRFLKEEKPSGYETAWSHPSYTGILWTKGTGR
jgi:hypothetical protein